MRRAAWLAAVLFCAAGAGRSGEPTIAEMQAKAQEMSAKKAGGGSAASPGDSQYAADVLRALDADVTRRIQELTEAKEFGRLGSLFLEVQKYDLAVQNLQAGLKNLSDGRGAGYLNVQLARACAMNGQPEQARQAIAEVQKLAGDNQWLANRARGLGEWLDALPARKAEAEGLAAKVKAEPADGDSRWKLLELYRNDYPRRLDELIGLIRFREECPEHATVKDGNCEWRLAEVMWDLGLRDEAFKLATGFAAEFPQHPACGSGDLTSRLAEYNYQLGAYEQALTLYRELAEKYPNHGANVNKGRDGLSNVERRTADIRERLKR